jgi:hypothetical protein
MVISIFFLIFDRTVYVLSKAANNFRGEFVIWYYFKKISCGVVFRGKVCLNISEFYGFNI